MGIIAWAQQNANPKAATLQDFEKRIDDYLNMEKRLAKGIAVNKPTDEPHLILERQHELARKIREARHNAKQGAIFSPEISQEFRRLLGLAMAGQNSSTVKKRLSRAEAVRATL